MSAETVWIAAFMRATGVREVRIPDELIAGTGECHVIRYHDHMRDETVFRLVEPRDVIEGEEVPAAIAELEAS